MSRVIEEWLLANGSSIEGVNDGENIDPTGSTAWYWYQDGTAGPVVYPSGTIQGLSSCFVTYDECLVSTGQDPRINELKKEIKKLKKERNHPMKTLYEVIVVSIDEEVLSSRDVVAEDREEAMLVANVGSILQAHGIKPKDATVIVRPLGEVKVRKPTQKVQIVKEDSD